MKNAIALESVNVEKSLPANAALWVLRLGVAYILVGAGYAKLSGAEQMVGLFDALGLGQWFRYFTGATEVAAALLLVIPGVTAFGALLAAGTMGGAILTHLFIIGGSPALPAAILAASLIVLYANRRPILRLLGR